MANPCSSIVSIRETMGLVCMQRCSVIPGQHRLWWIAKWPLPWCTGSSCVLKNANRVTYGVKEESGTGALYKKGKVSHVCKEYSMKLHTGSSGKFLTLVLGDEWSALCSGLFTHCIWGWLCPFPRAKARPGHDADHSPHLVPRSIMSRS
jgi:hypothetical protein